MPDSSMRSFYETLPIGLDPMLFSVGQFSFSWYAVCYIVGALGVVLLLYHRRSSHYPDHLTRENFWSLVSFILWGVLIGARLGYIFLYADASMYFLEPWRIISPYDFDRGVWIGIRGMSFFGGLVGGSLAAYIFSRRRALPFFPLADWLVTAIPIALFFGRLGNFMNGELFGRPTQSFLGMQFLSSESTLRHPSQLYEALGEGVVLFLLLEFFRRKNFGPGVLTALFLLGYGLLRVGLEFFREPDRGSALFLGSLTANQGLALLLVLIGLFLSHRFRHLWYNKNRTPSL